MKKVVEGSHAVSEAARLARVEVIAAYPITPQTHIVEALSEYCSNGTLNARFINVESEHSAMAAVIGASSGGARAFTASSSHGLAYMHEMLHWASAARLPIVMAEVNRALGPGWNIWTDQTDSLAQRDTGWIQLYCEDGQETLDTTLLAFRLAETINLPVMVVLDAFFLSHTFEPIDIPEQEQVDRFLPSPDPRLRLDTAAPNAFNQLVTPAAYMEMRYNTQLAMEEAVRRYDLIEKEFKAIFDRVYGPVEAVHCENAEIIIVTTGTVTGTCRQVLAELRARGERVGLFKLKMFRPFPAEIIRRHLGCAHKIAVVDRNFSFGAGGIFTQEIRAALCNLAPHPQVFGFIAGLGGRDITPETLAEIYNETKNRSAPAEESIWIGLNQEIVESWRN
ncbi:Pyruvate:ferredoxin oxidoreductase, alpha subunit (EC [Olavius sp. associated proteobacterium Delta 1]|nr:Pyruvate:ferredoxin oxidoreductase, alpha subunit (EC [Olavius sp. associated proteobacterium Delta 1]